MARGRVIPRQSSLILPEVLNPFVHRNQLSFVDKLKIAVMSVTIAPLRLLTIVILLLIAAPLAVVAMAGRTEDDEKKPLEGWRRKLCGSILMFLGRAAFFAAGFQTVKVIGRQASAQEAPILCVAPHTGFMDTILGFWAGLPSGVSRAENKQLPLVGTLVRFTQAIFVDRKDPNSRQKTIKEIERRAKSTEDWPQTVIFPEGTTTNASCLITFKIGAFIPGVAVQPVCMRFPNKLEVHIWTWDGPGFLSTLWLALCQFNNHCELEFLPVYIPNEQEKKDPWLFANNVRKVMARALGVPATDHTLEDCRLMMYAKKLELPMDSGIVEFRKLNKKLGLSYDKLEGILAKFSELIRKDDSGHMTLEKFAEYLHLPVSEELTEVFLLYDRDGSGTIDFREYVIGLSLISEPANDDQTIETAFKLFDADNNGYITLVELSQILQRAFGMTTFDVTKLFKQIDTENTGRISFKNFKFFAEKKPEYAKLFTTYHRKKMESDGLDKSEFDAIKNEALSEREQDVDAEATVAQSHSDNTQEDEDAQATVVQRHTSDHTQQDAVEGRDTDGESSDKVKFD